MVKNFIRKNWVKFALGGAVLIGAVFFVRYQSSENTEKFPVEEGDVRVAAVGDSITNGLYVTDQLKNHYPNQLDQMLGKGYGVVNFGVNNHNVQLSADYPYVFTETYQRSLEFEPNIVIFMLGTNDAKRHNWTDEERFKTQYLEVLATYQKLPSVTRIILASPATAFVDPEENVYNPAVVQVISGIVEDTANEESLEFVDINKLTSDKPEWYVEDGIHLNADGARGMAIAFYEQILLGG